LTNTELDNDDEFLSHSELSLVRREKNFHGHDGTLTSSLEFESW
jgi:hypothetical protein